MEATRLKIGRVCEPTLSLATRRRHASHSRGPTPHQRARSRRGARARRRGRRGARDGGGDAARRGPLPQCSCCTRCRPSCGPRCGSPRSDEAALSRQIAAPRRRRRSRGAPRTRRAPTTWPCPTSMCRCGPLTHSRWDRCGRLTGCRAGRPSTRSHCGPKPHRPRGRPSSPRCGARASSVCQVPAACCHPPHPLPGAAAHGGARGGRTTEGRASPACAIVGRRVHILAPTPAPCCWNRSHVVCAPLCTGTHDHLGGQTDADIPPTC